ncbi:MAG: tyrosine-protein phosphatase [Pirellulaceae bacterium]
MEPDRPFTDIHCHLLPGIDDGAGDWQTALAMARMAVAEGVHTVIATPHQLGRHTRNHGKAIRSLVAQMQRELDRQGILLRVLAGADVRIEAGLLDQIQRGDVLSLGDIRRHVLLELPHDLYLPLEPLLDDLHAAGMVGILSHPERNRGILQQPNIVRQLVDRGCLMQVTAGSLTGAFGRTVQRFSEKLIDKGLVHVVASDAHDLDRRSPRLTDAFRAVALRTGQATAVDLFCRNPAAVAAGEGVSAEARRAAVRRWPFASWFARAS